ncbi:glycosyltransferase family A protein [Kribbella albertanoniae]|uniref:Glycosyltransferase n=1 Tax=Kribbella albertanoniae TaxID=1266829 RepID=A0A4R4PDL7_9ACTN|nr:glycosyltransferase [Kribbella albertanoniae]TDC18702.1 glycosyltransferase [Kribbella albertanoniae]
MTLLAGILLVVIALLLGERQLAELRRVPVRTPDPRRHGNVSIVIPARNEAASLPTLLASLRSMAAEIVVVDDSSTDGTGDIARSSGARVVVVTAVPPGWTGKAWACHQGAQAASRPILLFLDADTELAPGALDGLLDLQREVGGLVSAQPFHRTEKAYEQLSSYFNVTSLMASGAYATRPSRQPMAFGPCLITARTDYERAGGHATVRHQILDDAQLAAAYARAGLPVRCFVGGAALRMRMYPSGPRQLAEGWTKNIASGAGQADTWSASVVGVWVAAHFAVAVGAVSAILSNWSAGPRLLWCGAWIAVAIQLRLKLRRIGSFRWWTWALFPIPLAAFGVLFLRSIFRTYVRHSVRWRDRSIELKGTREC